MQGSLSGCVCVHKIHLNKQPTEDRAGIFSVTHALFSGGAHSTRSKRWTLHTPSYCAYTRKPHRYHLYRLFHLSLPLPHPPFVSSSLPSTHTHTHRHTHIHTHTQTHRRTDAQTHRRTHTHTHTRTHAHAHSKSNRYRPCL